MSSTLRPQYTRARCGACGKKMAWVYKATGFSFGGVYEVECLSCRSESRFSEYANDIGLPVWPGSLEAAAALLTAAAAQSAPQSDSLGNDPLTTGEALNPESESKTRESEL